MPVLGVEVVEAWDAGGVVDEPPTDAEGIDAEAGFGVGTTGRESSPSPSEGGIPVRRYSTARSGLL